MRHIESKKDLKTLLRRMEDLKGADKLEDYEYWVKVVQGCIDEGLAMDEIDYENAPRWFRPLWTGLRQDKKGETLSLPFLMLPTEVTSPRVNAE